MAVHYETHAQKKTGGSFAGSATREGKTQKVRRIALQINAARQGGQGRQGV